MKEKLIVALFIFHLTMMRAVFVFGQSSEVEFRKRSELVLTQAADHYHPPSFNIGDPEKYYWPYVIARFEKYGIQDSIANY